MNWLQVIASMPLALPIILSATEYIKFLLMPGKFVLDHVSERRWPMHVEMAPLFSRMLFDRTVI
ncbi:hypothetical protein [Collimonas sp.]|uniref:hypothetical protein n=1 Tax=Collimonas sp. TaxID=1963772 RepID=UPI002BBA0982|nr:hypothetical protein [Collimonas sp.]HWX03084.1 hypothetical protein [Collimonas sp.]